MIDSKNSREPEKEKLDIAAKPRHKTEIVRNIEIMLAYGERDAYLGLEKSPKFALQLLESDIRNQLMAYVACNNQQDMGSNIWKKLKNDADREFQQRVANNRDEDDWYNYVNQFEEKEPELAIKPRSRYDVVLAIEWEMGYEDGRGIYLGLDKAPMHTLEKLESDIFIQRDQLVAGRQRMDAELETERDKLENETEWDSYLNQFETRKRVPRTPERTINKNFDEILNSAGWCIMYSGLLWTVLVRDHRNRIEHAEIATRDYWKHHLHKLPQASLEEFDAQSLQSAGWHVFRSGLIKTVLVRVERDRNMYRIKYTEISSGYYWERGMHVLPKSVQVQILVP